ncbi:MAG TPA: hypothetical protein PLT82_03005 [Candidatus Hydrogenedens sp.]|nr:hypothetical protein [Candidatus Hydrogenedens sp.]HOL19100.1 hypothetical protein [Candidatus Hydrogenedens sp.]HPP58082.1 hypothetical protein [Candidatus Hydrogenedens sp.]
MACLSQPPLIFRSPCMLWSKLAIAKPFSTKGPAISWINPLLWPIPCKKITQGTLPFNSVGNTIKAGTRSPGRLSYENLTL